MASESDTVTRLLTSMVTLAEGGGNYRTWSLDWRMLLEAHEYWGFIDGTKPRPGDPSTVPAARDQKVWDTNNRKVLAWIILSVKPAEKEYIRDCATAKEAWEVLEKMYSGKRTHRLLSKLKELTKLELGNDSMPEYLRAMRQTISELSVLGLKLDELAMKAFILAGLPEDYRILVTSLESQIEEIQVDDLTARLLEEYSKYGDLGNNPTSGMSFLARTKRVAGKQCTACGKQGHTVANCWSLHGKGEQECEYCGKYGHGEDDCFTKRFRESKKEKAGVAREFIL